MAEDTIVRPGSDELRLAVLIDADNARAQHLENLLAEIAKYGKASVRRAYGDWTSNQLNSWKNELLQHSVQPIQQFSYTVGKNATDSALIIDAMDLLHAGHLDGFCLVSSDSDFTRLAGRIREDGLVVYGFGERKTPKPFVAACDTFIYVENLTETQTEEPVSKEPALKRDRQLDRLLSSAVDTAAGDDGWANLGLVGSNLSRLASDFDSRSWGYKKLKDLMEHTPTTVGSRTPGTERRPTPTFGISSPVDSPAGRQDEPSWPAGPSPQPGQSSARVAQPAQYRAGRVVQERRQGGQRGQQNNVDAADDRGEASTRQRSM